MGKRAGSGPRQDPLLFRLRHLRMDGHLLNQHRLQGTAVAAFILAVILDDRLQEYFTRHVQSLGNFSENRVLAVQEWRPAKGNIETAARRVFLVGGPAGADRALLVAD